MENQNEGKGQSNVGWYIFIGCMFIGLGLGKFFNQAGVGLLVGMGVGFLARAIYMSDKK